MDDGSSQCHDRVAGVGRSVHLGPTATFTDIYVETWLYMAPASQ
jgi:hypothetical protein